MGKSSQNGGQFSTATEPILETLYTLLLNYPILKEKVNRLNRLVEDLIKPARALETQFLL